MSAANPSSGNVYNRSNRQWMVIIEKRRGQIHWEIDKRETITAYSNANNYTKTHCQYVQHIENNRQLMFHMSIKLTSVKFPIKLCACVCVGGHMHITFIHSSIYLHTYRDIRTSNTETETDLFIQWY